MAKIILKNHKIFLFFSFSENKIRHQKKRNTLKFSIFGYTMETKSINLTTPLFWRLKTLKITLVFKFWIFIYISGEKEGCCHPTHPLTHATGVAVTRRFLASYVTAFARQLPPPPAASMHPPKKLAAAAMAMAPSLGQLLLLDCAFYPSLFSVGTL
jgi:hypothetical protein